VVHRPCELPAEGERAAKVTGRHPVAGNVDHLERLDVRPFAEGGDEVQEGDALAHPSRSGEERQTVGERCRGEVLQGRRAVPEVVPGRSRRSRWSDTAATTAARPEAAARHPGFASVSLVEFARGNSLRRLRVECRRVKATAQSAGEERREPFEAYAADAANNTLLDGLEAWDV
jgi:hypothetical protein